MKSLLDLLVLVIRTLFPFVRLLLSAALLGFRTKLLTVQSGLVLVPIRTRDSTESAAAPLRVLVMAMVCPLPTSRVRTLS